MEKTKCIELRAIEPKVLVVTIEGTSDLVLNKMNDPTARDLTGIRNGKAKNREPHNVWEEIVTSMHWLKGKPSDLNPSDFSEETLKDCLKNNAPCITTFGLKKSFADAVVRAGIDKNGTKFKANVNIIGQSSNLVPIKFATHYIDEKLMMPKAGSPVLVRLNRFSGWSATFEINYLDNVYTAEQILDIVATAGFGIGIGSGRSSDYGRYKIASIYG